MSHGEAGTVGAPLQPPAPAEVGSFPPNGFGLHDVHGNVAEWCADVYDSAFYALPGATAPDPIRNLEANRPPFEPSRRVLRGGSWLEAAGECRSAARAEAQSNTSGVSAARGLRPVWAPRVTLTSRRVGHINR